MSQAQPPSTVVYEPGRFLLPATTFFAFLELAEDPQAHVAPEDQRVDVMAGPTTHLPLLLTQLAGLAPRGDVHLGAAIEIAEEGLPGLLATDPRLLETAVDGHGIDDARTAAALSRRVETYRAAGL